MASKQDFAAALSVVWNCRILPLNPMKRFSLQNDNPTMGIEDTEMGKLVYHREI